MVIHLLEQSPSHAVRVTAPFTQGGLWCGATGETILYKSPAMADTLLEQFKQKFPQWGRQIEKLDQGITICETVPWEEETDETMRFAWILTKCQSIAEMMGGVIMAAVGPFEGEATIAMDLPAFALVSSLGENLLCYLGRYARDFSAHPQGKGVRIQIGLPYSGKIATL